jgi:5-formaminoimidazole-4-carboxamide-1-beta-D-ribofuranosyl 5'-monophosphate synthetase
MNFILLNNRIKITPTIIGASINAITATMWPLKVYCISKKVIAVTNVTALTEPYAAAMAPELSMLKRFLRIKP